MPAVWSSRCESSAQRKKRLVFELACQSIRNTLAFLLNL